MSGQVTARYKSKEIKGNQEANQPSAPVAVQQPSDEQREEKEAPPERQDIISDKDKAVAEAPMDHGEGPGLEAGIQKLHLNETEGIREDDTDLKGANFASGKPVKMPEAVITFALKDLTWNLVSRNCPFQRIRILVKMTQMRRGQISQLWSP
ncbi:P antigen family member 3-like isoform X3 [Hyaena hyaena]|uniref:P antigen family member 3-like isoform X3 n=1 Tax=Hyaena hyaena TaxID=95912 RepID=UPI001922DF15|nr:P antigen family member 3-like isoform X3 [Hyaena hyaena]XP_039081628.1 P antigen family member 3-like isoform X3 [Hyaena hyaena]